MNEFDLKQLSQPALPEGLAAGITARIARLDEEGPTGVGEPPRDRLAWAAGLGGVTIGLSAQVYRLVAGEATLDHLISLRISGGMGGVIEMLPASPAVAVLVAASVLSLAALHALLRGTGHGR
jgi:hypothetical protein